MVDELTSDVHELDEEKTKYALCKFWENDKPSRCLAKLCKKRKTPRGHLRSSRVSNQPMAIWLPVNLMLI